jgi:hypothetical protein
MSQNDARLAFWLKIRIPLSIATADRANKFEGRADSMAALYRYPCGELLKANSGDRLFRAESSIGTSINISTIKLTILRYLKMLNA